MVDNGRPVVSTRIDTSPGHGAVAVLVLENPPVNMGNAQVRTELLQALRSAGQLPGLVGVVLASGLDDFYAGSDIKEFDGPITEPQLPAVIAAIDDLEVPVVAALCGSTLGGGLELALACDVRVAAEGTVTGLPEVTLGILPGAGGTVRLPRLTGVAAAVDLVGTARRVDARTALELGIVDRVVPRPDLLTAALVAARTGTRRRVADLAPPASDPGAVTEAVSRVLRRARPNVVEAVDLVRTGVDLPTPEALRRERAAFEALRAGQESSDLRYGFFATRSAARGLRTDATGAAVQHLGIAGAGTMGSSIAALCLSRGLDVTVVDANAAVLERAAPRLQEAARAPGAGRLRLVGTLAELAGVDLVVDAVFEDVDVKRELFAALDGLLAPGVVLASNTSYLDLDHIGAVLADPTRFAGLHFFNPADKNPLVEVVRTARSSEATLATLAGVVRRLGKTGIAARVGEGFVANRVYADYRAQAEFLLEDGASPRQVDDAMTALGLAIGPFAVADMSGLDIAWARRRRLAPDRDPAQRYVAIPDVLCEAGRLGRKTGAGWYRYSDQAPRGADDPFVADVIATARTRKGLQPRKISVSEIQQRILVSMLVAASGVVASGTARAASDVDVALVAGFAFPRWLGGPLRYCSRRSQEWLLEGLRAVAHSDPVGFAGALPAFEGVVPDPVRDVLTAVGPHVPVLS